MVLNVIIHFKPKYNIKDTILYPNHSGIKDLINVKCSSFSKDACMR